jgi:toxin-antitoxin system PIN domain toxin
MTLVDVNVLLYAYNPSFPRHERARGWLERTFSAPEPVRLAWMTILAFLRIVTNPRAFEHPLSGAEARAIVSDWLVQPSMGILEPGERHWPILSELMATVQARGSLVMDAHLAALAMEHGAILCTSDRDFARFPKLRLLDPLESGD